ncbi:uncharacterized protein [Rutidosis leptorrhynchoides]|uniref:uncharacterized protein n=1 Tax=Rutidosis leptorrhynchoides TaxID=125765 RepID=UPI003A9A0A2D
MADTNRFHPAVIVNSIKNFIPITLEMENSKYGAWSELFKIHCRAFNVIDHIIPPTTTETESSTTTQTTPPTGSTNTTPPPTESWSRLDDIVLRRIYSTILGDLIHTILAPDSTALQAWN